VSEHEELDRAAFRPGFGSGGVPWPLMLLYLCFLVFFTWYVLEYQLPDYLKAGAPRSPQGEVSAPADSGG